MRRLIFSRSIGPLFQPWRLIALERNLWQRDGNDSDAIAALPAMVRTIEARHHLAVALLGLVERGRIPAFGAGYGVSFVVAIGFDALETHILASRYA